MNREQILANKIRYFFNPLFTSVYAFIYYLFLMVLFNGNSGVGTIVLKSIVLYTLTTCFFPVFFIYILNGNSFINIEENTKNNNASYRIISISYLVSYMYFSILNLPTLLNTALIIPFFVSLIPLFLRKRTAIIYDIIMMGAITSFVLLLTIEFYYVFSIFPLLLIILCSGLIVYSYRIQNLYSSAQTTCNYLGGCILTAIIVLFVLII